MPFKTSHFVTGECYVTPIISESYLITDNGVGAILVSLSPDWIIIRTFYNEGRKNGWRAFHTKTMKAARNNEDHPEYHRVEEAMMFLEAIASNWDAYIICDECEKLWDECNGHS